MTNKIFSTISMTAIALLVLVQIPGTAAAVPQALYNTPSVAFEQNKTQTLTIPDNINALTVQRDSYTATTTEQLAAIRAEEERVIQEAAAAEAAKVAAEQIKQQAEEESTKEYVAPDFTPDPGSAQAYALTAVTARGWGQSEFNCLVSLWNKESGWRANAMNSSSGAYGIPQALPGEKMVSAGEDWATNANTQIEWGLGYISGRYGTPCGAWAHSVDVGWY
jgi:hypothetical protein